MVELREVHRQRLKGAVEKAMQGVPVTFRIAAGEPSTVFWHTRFPGIHVIASDYGDMRPWLEAIQQEFERMRKERGVQ